MKAKFLLLSILVVLLQTFSAFAFQGNQIPVKGVVADGQNNPLAGVTVRVKGTTLGTTTDQDGKFTISVPDNKAVLVFSFIGFKAQEITVGEGRSFNVALEASITELSETVVVAYGVQKKESVVAAISSIKATGVLQQTPASNIGNQIL